MEQLQQSLETTGSISLPQKVALLSHLKALNRDSSSVIRQSKQAAAHQAQLSDGVHAQVQNLLYERRHLEQEIERCRNFETSFDKVPLVSLDEYRKLNGGKEEDEHVLMLNRLKFELRTRQELNDHRNQLQEVRSSINSENNQTKNSLEDLDSDLDKFVDVGGSIHAFTIAEMLYSLQRVSNPSLTSSIRFGTRRVRRKVRKGKSPRMNSRTIMTLRLIKLTRLIITDLKIPTPVKINVWILIDLDNLFTITTMHILFNCTFQFTHCLASLLAQFISSS